MTRTPVVSVVVPTWNNSEFVTDTLDSILAQTFADYELLIADHGSRDETWDLISLYASDDRVTLMKTEPGGGASRNWNRVTAEAQGTFLKLVCGDDLLYPTCLEEQVEAMRDHPQVVMVASKRDIVDARGARLLSDRGLAGLSGQVEGRSAIRAAVRAGVNIFGEPACVLLRNDVVREVGAWSPDAQYVLDLDLYLRVLQRGDLFALPRSLAAFRVSATQWSIALAKAQARHTTTLHVQARAANPGTISAHDTAVGAARAYTAALGRRIAYWWWSDRLVPDPRT
jgi:glycosyltransferase involved in cell wall biosynthesis